MGVQHGSVRSRDGGADVGALPDAFGGIVANPDAAITTLPLLTPAEQQQLLVEWNNHTREYNNKQYVHQMFENAGGTDA